MRKLEEKEREQRGCAFCIEQKRDSFPVDNGTAIVTRKFYACPHDVCPFTELDEFKQYGDYVKSLGELRLNVGKAGAEE